jgi:membrane fusion protein, multidrug efflux system
MQTKYIPILLIIILAIGCKNREVKSTSVEVVRVRIAGVTSEKISIPVHSTGLLVSSEEMKLSFKTGGIIATINVKEGNHVKKGDLLASLNLSEIRASVDQAKNGYEKALRDFTRMDNLYRDSSISLEKKQNAATALNVAKASLEIAQFNLTHSMIVAPENGLILKQFVKQNELVSSGYPVFLFGSSGKYWKVKSGLSDKDIVKVNIGDSTVVTFDVYPGVEFPAVVDQLGEISNPYTGTYETELLLQGSDYRLASGFVAGVNIFPVSKKSFSMVPVGAIVEADGQKGYVFLVTSAMTVKKIRIDIEAIIGSMAAVKGIPEGTTEIVSEGAAYLKDGMRVNVVK